MASKNLAADIKAYNQKVSSGQKTQPTTKYNTPSQQGRTAKSYTRQNIADQKSNKENSQQKKAQQGRESAQQKAQQYQQEQQKKDEKRYSSEAQGGGEQQEQKGRNFLDEAVNGRAEAEKKAQDKARGFSAEANDLGRYGKGNIDLHARNTGLHDENGKLMTVRSMSFNEDGKEVLVPTIVKRDGKWTQLSDDEAIDWYHRTGEHLGKFDSIEEANQYADRLHKQQEKLYASRTESAPERKSELLTQYADAVEAERKAIATTPKFSRQVKDATATREDLEKAIMDENRLLGLDPYDGLENWSQRQDILQSRTKENTAQYAALLGTPFEWLDTHLTYGDKEQGERGALGDFGARLFGNAYNLNKEAQEDFANGTEGMSGLAKVGIGLGKTVANTAEDAMANFLVPGMGLKMAAARSAGAGALEQADREKNDIDARMGKLALNGALTYLAERAVGGAEAAYSKSWLSKELQEAIPKLASPMMKRLFNTEWLEEGVEYGLNYLGDKYFGLDPNAEFNLSEMGQQMAVGYFMGTIFNGIIGGIDYDTPKIRNVADEAARAAQMGLDIDEAAVSALAEPDENIKIIAGNQKPGKHEAGANIETETEVNPATSPEAVADTSPKGRVESILSNPQGENGQLSNSQVRQILENPDMYQEFLRAAGMEPGDIDHSSKSAERKAVKEAADRIAQQRNNQEVTDIVNEWNEQQGAETPTPTEPNADTRARVETILANADAEQRGLAPGEIRQILEDPAALNAYAEATGTTARQARTDLENRLNGAPDETGSTAMNDRYQNADTAWDRFWNAANDGADALVRLIAEDPDNMAEYMKYYEQATGETMSNDPVELWRQLQDLSNDSQQGGTTTENNANGMPRNEGNGQTGQSQGQNNANQNPFFNNGNQQQNNNDTSAPGTGKEKTSQFFSNNLTRREGADVRSPLTYLTKTEAETLQNAMYRLNMNGDAEMATMMASTMWSDEQVKMGKIIGQNLLNEARATGNWAAYDAWRKVEREHATAIARALRAYGRDPDAEMNAEGIAKMAANYFSMLRDDIRAAQESGGKLTQDIDVDLETIDAAQAAVTNATNILGEIEAEEANLRNQGFSDEEIFDRVKDRYLDIAQEIIAKQYGGFILDDITGKNADVRDGIEESTTILRNLLATESPEYIRNYVKAVIGGITTDVRYMGRPTAAQRAKQVSSIQKLCQLFALGTTKRNLLGNATFGLFDWASNNTAGVLADSVISLFTGQRTRGLETGIFGGRNYKNGFEAARRSALEIAANLDMKDDGKYISGTSAFSKYDVGGRFLAKTNQLLSYALNTTDAAFVGFNEQSASDAALRANDRRGGEMTEETAQKIGENEAEYRTFKNTTATQKAVEAIRNVLDLIGWGGEVTHFQGTNIPNGRKGGFGLGTYIAPYIGVPVNLGLKIAEYSPFNVAKGAVEAGQAIKGARNAGGNAQALQDAMVLQNKAAGDIGRGVFGTAVVLLLKSLMKQAREEGTEWFKDWNLEKDSAIKAQNNAEGKSGQQINRSMLQRILNGEPAGKWETGDDLVNMSAIEPMNQTLALASLLADDEHASSFGDYLKALGTATVDSLQDLPAIASLTQIADTINYNKEYDTTYEENEDGELVENREVNWGRTLGNAGLATIGKSASGFIPAPVRHAASVQDEYQRDTRGDNAAETAWNQVVNSIPTFEVGGRTFGRGSLPVKMDAFGNPVTQGDKETRKKNAFNALKYTQVNQTPESKEINRLYEETGKSFMQSSSAPRTVTYGSGDKKRTVELTADEGRSFVQGKNKDFEKNVSSLMSDTIYPDVDRSLQTGLMGEVEKYTKDAAKAKLADEKGVEFKSRYEGVSDLDDPIGYIGVNKGFNLADSAEKYDVVDMLIPEIQGMSKADRDFLRDKNSTAMSYYDFLTPNKHGEKASSAEVVHDYKVAAKENADKRGVQSASGVDKFKALYDGYYDGKYNDDDVAAFMTKQQSDGDYDATKGRVAVFLAALASGKNTSQALQLARSADIDNDGSINEKTVFIKGQQEATKTLKKGDLDKNGWDVFNEIMYPNKRR